MTKNREQVARLIRCLENARKRPEMYFGEIDVWRAKHFLDGMNLAVESLLRDTQNIRNQITVARGLHPNTVQPSGFLSQLGMTTAEMIDEMLVIEIEVLRRLSDE